MPCTFKNTDLGSVVTPTSLKWLSAKNNPIWIFFFPSPLSSAYMWSNCWGNISMRETQTSLSPATLPSSSWGTPRYSQVKENAQSTQQVLGLRWDLFPVGCIQKPPKGGVQEAYPYVTYPDARNTSTDSFWCKGAVALLRAPTGWRSSYPTYQAETSYSMKESNSSFLYVRSCSLTHNPSLVTRGEGCNVNTLKSLTFDFLQKQFPQHNTISCSILSSPVKNISRHLNLYTWGKLPWPSEAFHSFPVENHAFRIREVH